MYCRNVKKVAVVFVVAALMLMPLSGAASPGSNIKVEKEEIEISGNEVTEKIFFTSILGSYNGTIEIWAPSNSHIECMGNEIKGNAQNNVVEINLEENGLMIPSHGTLLINVSYALKGNFDYKVLYPTDLMTIALKTKDYPRGNIPLKYEGNDMYTSNLTSVEKDTSISIEFVKQSAAGGMNAMSAVAGSVAILLAILLLAFAIRRRREEGLLAKEPVESLELRKRLLTDALKTLEIEHEKKKIPDAYYRSIKDYFKKEAIRVLREIDRRK